MDESKQNITRQAEITVATEAEPVTAQGEYAASADGFVLRFNIGNDAFVISHTAHSTVVTATGVMSYEITLNADGKNPQTLLSTPFGKVRFDVTSTVRDVRVSGSELRILLQYTLSSDAAGQIDRAVALTARLL